MTTEDNELLTPDLSFSESLAEQGYWIYPCRNRQKGAREINGKGWADFLDMPQGQELLASYLNQRGVTGACITLRPSDPTPLLILDFDYDPEHFPEPPAPEYTWKAMTGLDGPIPTNLGITRSVSGGHHFWFQIPSSQQKFGASFDLGAGLQGEVRASSRERQFLMLPGSIALSKSNSLGMYEVLRFPESGLVSDLCPLPEVALERMVARAKISVAEEGEGIPTEVSHLIWVLENTCDTMPQGKRNELVAKIGQVIGRISPAPQMSGRILALLWAKLSKKLGRDFSQEEFTKSVQSGYRTGRKNGNLYAKHESRPKVVTVEAEVESLFGGRMWAKKLIDSKGKSPGYRIGIGGSPKRPDEAKCVIHVEYLDLEEILPALASRCPQADPGSVVTSPLFVAPGWRKVLLFELKRTMTLEPLGIPIEDQFFERLAEWARAASADSQFRDAVFAKGPKLGAQTPPYLVIEDAAEGGGKLCLSNGATENLMLALGEIDIAQRMVKKHLLKVKHARKIVHVVELKRLGKGTKNHIMKQFARWISRKEKQSAV